MAGKFLRVRLVLSRVITPLRALATGTERSYMRVRHKGFLFVITLALCSGLVAGPALAADTNPEGRVYHASVNPLADVEQALDRAKESNRLLLVVAGGNWCHDSRALAARLKQSPLAEIVQKNYELQFVSVGYFEQGRDVMQRFGVPHYYATPTVLIIDPANEELINAQDRHQWGNAYNIDMPTSVEYFEKWLEHDLTAESVAPSDQVRQLNLEIDKFEQQLADRLVAGYAIVGPLLKEDVAGDKPEGFEARWNELRDFRSAIPKAIDKLRNDARQRVAAGEENVQLTFPEFAPLSWEAR